MPELPDITVYIEALERRIIGAALQDVRLVSPFLLRTVEPPLAAVAGRRVVDLRRLGKRIAIGLEDELWLVLHLMIAGRLHWRQRLAPVPGKRGLAAFDFPDGALILTEAGSKKRASLHVVRGEAALAAHDPGGLEVLAADVKAFQRVLAGANHTLKRALTDPRLFSGVGNAYSDEILHRARLSPVAMTQSLAPKEIARLYAAARQTLSEWCDRLRADTGQGFPENVTAFRDGMAVHGRFGKPCPVSVRRRCNASATPRGRPTPAPAARPAAACWPTGRCRAWLKKDWPRTLDELERR